VCGGGNIFCGGGRLVWRPSLSTFGGGGGRGDGRRGRRRGSGGSGGRRGGRRGIGGSLILTDMALSMQLVCDSIIPWKMMNANK